MALPRLSGLDKNLQLIQDYIARAFIPLQASPFQGGILIESYDLVTGGDNLIAHGLGRTPKIWTLAGILQDATVWEESSATIGNKSRTDLYLNLKCSANCTVALWVS